MLETNYSAYAPRRSSEALAGAAHLFLIQFDRWRAERNLEPHYTGTELETATDRLRGALNDAGIVAQMPRGPSLVTRVARGWRAFRANA